MKRAFVFLALTLALVSTGCNTCRPRLFGGWFNNGDSCGGCESGCGGWMGASSGSTTCTNCSNHVSTGGDGWVPAGSGNMIHGYVPEGETLPSPSQIGPLHIAPPQG
jgi:hypothetical protein